MLFTCSQQALIYKELQYTTMSYLPYCVKERDAAESNRQTTDSTSRQRRTATGQLWCELMEFYSVSGHARVHVL